MDSFTTKDAVDVSFKTVLADYMRFETFVKVSNQMLKIEAIKHDFKKWSSSNGGNLKTVVKNCHLM